MRGTNLEVFSSIDVIESDTAFVADMLRHLAACWVIKPCFIELVLKDLR